MATSNRDVKLSLSVETLGEEGIKELQKAVEALGRDGGAAAPEFQKLADEIGRLGEQSKALSTFRELSEETDKLAARQADSAASTAQMAAKLQAMGYEAYLYEPAAGGHGYGKDNKERAAFTALGYAFLKNKIGWRETEA